MNKVNTIAAFIANNPRVVGKVEPLVIALLSQKARNAKELKAYLHELLKWLKLK